MRRWLREMIGEMSPMSNKVYYPLVSDGPSYWNVYVVRDDGGRIKYYYLDGVFEGFQGRTLLLKPDGTEVVENWKMNWNSETRKIEITVRRTYTNVEYWGSISYKKKHK